jgi:hypothetical protein
MGNFDQGFLPDHHKVHFDLGGAQATSRIPGVVHARRRLPANDLSQSTFFAIATSFEEATALAVLEVEFGVLPLAMRWRPPHIDVARKNAESVGRRTRNSY